MTRKPPPACRSDKAQTTAGKRVDKTGTEATLACGDAQILSHVCANTSLAGYNGQQQVFDANKVEAIKLAIADGKFQVDAEKVTAWLLITTVKNLLQARRN